MSHITLKDLQHQRSYGDNIRREPEKTWEIVEERQFKADIRINMLGNSSHVSILNTVASSRAAILPRPAKREFVTRNLLFASIIQSIPSGFTPCGCSGTDMIDQHPPRRVLGEWFQGKWRFLNELRQEWVLLLLLLLLLPPPPPPSLVATKSEV